MISHELKLALGRRVAPVELRTTSNTLRAQRWLRVSGALFYAMQMQPMHAEEREGMSRPPARGLARYAGRALLRRYHLTPRDVKVRRTRVAMSIDPRIDVVAL